METNIRQLKANFSAYIKKPAAGEAVTVSVRNRPVARIVPFKLGALRSKLKDLPGGAMERRQTRRAAEGRSHAQRRVGLGLDQ